MAPTKRRRDSYPTPPSSSRRRMGVLDNVLSSPSPAGATLRKMRRRNKWKVMAKKAVDIAAAVSPEVATAKKLLTAVMGPTKKRSYGSKDNSHLGRPFSQGKRITSLADKFSNKGTVRKVEVGSVVVEPERQVCYLAHSTMPATQVLRQCIQSLLKRLLTEASIAIKNENDPLTPNQYYYNEIRLYYKVKDGDIVTEKKFILTAAETLAQVTSAWITWLRDTLSGTSGLMNQMLSLRYYAQFGTTTDALLMLSELDLTTVRFEIYSKSFLKMQNRTINSTGNDSTEDVDNVPISGRFFEYATNGTIYRDFSTPASVASSAQVTTDNNYGLLPRPTTTSDTGTNIYKEIPDRTQFVGCKKSGTALLQPGQIRTSLLYDKMNVGLNKIIQVILCRVPNTDNQPNQIWMGKTRLFAWEKVINAVAMTSTNQFNLAYELHLEIGAICTASKSTYTAPSISQIVI